MKGNKKKKITVIIFFLVSILGVNRTSLLIFVGNGQFFSPGCSPVGQNFSAVLGRHSFPETVLVLALSYRWLECSFHRCSFLEVQKYNLFLEFKI
jgi:hypothetical protein